MPVSNEIKCNLLVISPVEITRFPILSTEDIAVTSMAGSQLEEAGKNLMIPPDMIIVRSSSGSNSTDEKILSDLQPFMSKVKEIKKKLQQENESLKKQIEAQILMILELEQTNNNLVSATWRERDLKKKLAAALNELNRTKILVENQHKRITESINYAKRIQCAINPTEKKIREKLPDSFILYKPKDVISGDFPWFYEKDNYYYVAVADCTGHGVPGAMMAMIGTLLLNDIVGDPKMLTPSEILTRLHHAVIDTLKQTAPGNNSNDGLDIALCRIDMQKKEIVFSGAHRPLFYVHEQALTQYNGDKFPIGGVQYKDRNKYTDHFIKINNGDAVFIFSDGLPDQFGGPDNKKFLTERVKNGIMDNQQKGMEEIKKALECAIVNWIGNSKQLDDMLMLGMRFGQ